MKKNLNKLRNDIDKIDTKLLTKYFYSNFKKLKVAK